MKLWAISDLHVGHRQNAAALERLPAHPDDWLVVAGDVGETLEHLRFAWQTLGPRFARLLWVPGNHELWTTPNGARAGEPRGEERSRALVELCREHGVLTPEDPWPLWPGDGGPHVVALLFTLYDYSFRPAGVSEAGAIGWAGESGVLCADELRLDHAPYASKSAWCHARCDLTERRLAEAAAAGHPLVLVDHFPLRRDLVLLPRIPRFSIWCGTRRTEDWPRRFGARVVVSGHLHVRSSTLKEGVWYEEVSVGYPAQWHERRGMGAYLRQVLPRPEAGSAPPIPTGADWIAP